MVAPSFTVLTETSFTYRAVIFSQKEITTEYHIVPNMVHTSDLYKQTFSNQCTAVGSEAVLGVTDTADLVTDFTSSVSAAQER